MTRPKVNWVTCLLHSTLWQVIQLPPNETFHRVEGVKRVCTSLPADLHRVVRVLM